MSTHIVSKNQTRSGRYLKKYGMAFRHYRKLMIKQRRRCAICGKKTQNDHLKDDKKCDLFVDHCHKTGKVRGLLCHACNAGLGFFRDDPALLDAAIAYLARTGEAAYSPFDGIPMLKRYRKRVGGVPTVHQIT